MPIQDLVDPSARIKLHSEYERSIHMVILRVIRMSTEFANHPGSTYRPWPCQPLFHHSSLLRGAPRVFERRVRNMQHHCRGQRESTPRHATSHEEIAVVFEKTAFCGRHCMIPPWQPINNSTICSTRIAGDQLKACHSSTEWACFNRDLPLVVELWSPVFLEKFPLLPLQHVTHWVNRTERICSRLDILQKLPEIRFRPFDSTGHDLLLTKRQDDKIEQHHSCCDVTNFSCEGI